MVDNASLETVIIFTERMEALAEFYRQALHLGEWERSPGHLGQRVGPVYLGFDQVDKVDGAPPGSVTLWFTVNDIQAIFDRLVALGAKVRYPPTQKPWGAVLASMYDPDGNLVGLAQGDGE